MESSTESIDSAEHIDTLDELQTPVLDYTHKDIIFRKNDFGPCVVIIFVGLPGTGKSFVARKLARYFNFLGLRARVFNVGNKRRAEGGAGAHADFFDPSKNSEAIDLRTKWALETLEEGIRWLKNERGKVCLLDATNSSIARRKMVIERIHKEENCVPLFIENIVQDPDLLAANIKMKLKSPDYFNIDPMIALTDFKARLANYQKQYEPIGQFEEMNNLPYVKLMDVGRKIVAFMVHGFIQSQVIFYLANIHIKPRTIWLTRHGESPNNLTGRIGGNPHLTEKGLRYAKALAKFMHEKHGLESSKKRDHHEYTRLTHHRPSLPTTFMDDDGHTKISPMSPLYPSPRSTGIPIIMTSMQLRSVETAQFFPSNYDIRHMRQLNNLDPGRFEGMTADEIKRDFPKEWSAKEDNPLVYRWPQGGESLVDVAERIQPLVIEMERLQENILIISHLAVCRTILCYWAGIDYADSVSCNLPMHTLIRITPKPHGALIKRYHWDEELDQFKEQIDGVALLDGQLWKKGPMGRDVSTSIEEIIGPPIQ